MKIKWLIEKDIFPQYEKKLVEELEKLNIDYILYSEYDVKKLENLLSEERDDIGFISHTSIQDARRILRTKCYPGVFLTVGNYECYKYYGYYGNKLLNNDYLLIGTNDLIRRKEEIFNFIIGDRIFIRPSNGIKSFSGQIISKKNFDLDVDILLKSYGGIEDDLALLSSRKDIEEEYRFIIIGGEVISGSLYLDKENAISLKPYYDKEIKIEDNKELYDYVYSLIGNYIPDNAYTIDICKLTNGELKILEINSCCCASWYGANIRDIVLAMTEEAIKTFEI